MKKIDYNQFVRDNIISCDISYRGGNLKVDVSNLFPKVNNAVMGAYQNYLGGGIAGRVVGASMFDPNALTTKQKDVFLKVREACIDYFIQANNGGGDDYMQENFGADRLHNSRLPVSAY